MLKSDVILISDTTMLSLDTPTITTGLRGLCYLEVEITGQRGISSLFAQLSSRDIVVQSMRNKSNRLEELFMGLVENRAGRQQAAAEDKS